MNLALHDPQPPRHDYLSPMYLQPLEKYARDKGIPVSRADSLSSIKNSTVCCLADYLDLDTVNMLKNNGNKIVGFSVTDSSYVSQCCREAAVMSKIDLIFALTGIQTINEGREMVIDKEFNIKLEKRQFLPDEDWSAFNLMRLSGRLKSLPYVHAERQPDVQGRPYATRSQKALIRGGNHMRRFILALKLMERDLLDINSGFFTAPYFQDDMNPQFRYCDKCRQDWKKNKRHSSFDGVYFGCSNQLVVSGDYYNDLGGWNNKCPNSFEQFAKLFCGPDRDRSRIESLFNTRWLTQQEHLSMLARITFTSDLKWLFSIYAPQRFWDAAMVGCVNLLPERTMDQEYFPDIGAGIHYLTFKEDFSNLQEHARITEGHYDIVSREARSLYDQWMRPTDYAINTNLLHHIITSIEAIQ
jgi:hypothetical protein